MSPTLTGMQPRCECGARPQGRLATPRQFVEPPGFTTSWDDAVPEAKLFRLKPPPNSEVFLIDGALPNSFAVHNTLRGVTIGYRSDGQLFRANPGKKYSQFRVCLDCGRSFERAASNNFHRTPWRPKCGGTRIERVDLGYRFKTDTLQLRFDGLHPAPPPITERSFWLSFQTAMVASAAEVLSIPRDDIDATHRSQSSGGFGGELVIYDRVPGGAGYVEAIKERLREILDATLERVAHCTNATCDPLGSCYVCLRTYGNQFQLELSRRNAVSEWLGEALSRS
jgi:hypothetical protein